MRTLPPEPSIGDKIKADLIRDLIRAIRERTLIKGPNYALASGPNGTVIKFDPPKPQESENNPLPFEVRWDSSLSSGSGSWKIYLPDVESLCLVKEDYEEITGVTAIQDADGNDTDWYTIDDISSSGSEDVWLVVTVPDSGTTGTASAELLSDEGQASTGEKVYNVHIAALEVVAATSSTPAEHNVRQYVDSAVIIAGVDTPVDVPRAWQYDEAAGAFLRPYVFAGNDMHTVSTGNANIALPAALTHYYVHIEHQYSGSLSFELTTTQGQNSTTDTWLWVGDLDGSGQVDGIYSMPTLPIYAAL